MIEYMNIPALVCVSLLGAGALAMIVGSLLKMQWATEGKDFAIHLSFMPDCNDRFRLDMV